jgi:hypothetical protein
MIIEIEKWRRLEAVSPDQAPYTRYSGWFLRTHAYLITIRNSIYFEKIQAILEYLASG